MKMFDKIYYAITNFFQNPYGNVRKVIPRFEWKDRDHILQDVLFQLFLGYVEDEDKYWMEYENKERVDDFIKVYHYLKKDRPKLEKALADMDANDNFESLIDEMEKRDTEAEEIIFKWRGTMWT